MAHLGVEGELKMLSIQLDPIKSRWVIRVEIGLFEYSETQSYFNKDSFTSCGIDVTLWVQTCFSTCYIHMLQNHCQLCTGDVHVCFY